MTTPDNPTNPESGDDERAPAFVLKLFVAGNSPMSQRAIERARHFCETYLQGNYELTVIDLYQQPEMAEEAQIIAAPTLVKKLPPPLRQLIGDLSNTSRLLIALDIPDPGQA